MSQQRRSLPPDNVDEVFIFNAVAILERGIPQLRAGLQSGEIETVVRNENGQEAPGPSRGYWKSTAGELTMLTTGRASVELLNSTIEGHVFVARASLEGLSRASADLALTWRPAEGQHLKDWCKLPAVVAEADLRVRRAIGPNPSGAAICKALAVMWGEAKGEPANWKTIEQYRLTTGR